MAGSPSIHWSEGWSDIIAVCDHFEECLETKATYEKFPPKDLTTIVYKMSTQKAPYNWASNLYNGHTELIDRYIGKFISLTEDPSFAPTLEDLLGELRLFDDKFKKLTDWLSKLFGGYINRYYCKYHGVPKTQEVAVDHYRSFYENTVSRLVVARERDPATISDDFIAKLNGIGDEALVVGVHARILDELA